MATEAPREENPLQNRLSAILEYGSPVSLTRPERVLSLIQAALSTRI